jgi:hypothetical protein
MCGDQKLKRPWEGAFDPTQASSVQADSTLIKLMRNSLALPGTQVQELPSGAYLMTEALALNALAIRDRCAELGGDSNAHIEAALHALGRGGLI